MIGIQNLASIFRSVVTWAPRLGRFGSIELCAQVAGLLTSLIVVRGLSKDSYAWYSLANNLQGGLALFTMTGIATCFMPMLANARSKIDAGEVIATAAKQRYLLVAFGSLIGVPLTAYTLLCCGCTWYAVLGLTGFAVLSLIVAIQRQMYSMPLMVKQHFFIPQYEILLSTLIRLLCVSLTAWVLPSALPVLAISVLSSLPGLAYLRKKTNETNFVDTSAKPNVDIARRMRQHFWIGLPVTITYLFESQIAMLFIAHFGELQSVADLGALSRVSLLFAVPTSIATGIVSPMLAIEADLAKARSLWIRTSLVAVIFGMVMLFATILLGPFILAILGNEYSNLQHELRLIACLQTFIFVTNVFQLPVGARGWVRLSWSRPIFVVGAQVFASGFLDLSTVAGAIGLMAAGSLGNTILNVVLLIRGWQGKGQL